MDLSRARIAAQPTDKILRIVVRAVRSVLDADGAGLRMPAPVTSAHSGRDRSEPISVLAVDDDPAGRCVEELLDPARESSPDSTPTALVHRFEAVPGRHGLLVAVRNDPVCPFDPEDVRLAEAFAREAALALQSVEIREELERLALLEERERIAMDLHDGVVQALFVVGLSLQNAEDVVDDADEMRARLGYAVDSIDSTIRHLRDYIFGLRPTEFADRHITRALADLVEMAERSGRVTMSLHVDPRAASAVATRASSIIQAAREAVSNAIHHSGGDTVEVRFVAGDDHVALDVSDNGAGFSPDDARGQGQGLQNLRTRAADLGGSLEIASNPGAGTRVTIRVPL